MSERTVIRNYTQTTKALRGRQRVYEMANTHALQSSFFPLGPFLHSGLDVVLQLVHFWMPMGLFPALLALTLFESLDPDSDGLTRRLGGGTSFAPESSLPPAGAE